MNPPIKVLIKASGDVCCSEEAYRFVREREKRAYVVFLFGAGSLITERLERAGISYRFEEPFGRIIESLEGQSISLRAVWERETELRKKFFSTNVEVVPPIVSMGGVSCPSNGDHLVKLAYWRFNEILVLTKKDRKEKKEDIFKNYPRIKTHVI